MVVLSSRPSQPVNSGPSDQEVLDAAAPAANILNWVATIVRFSDDSPRAVREGAQTIEDALSCLLLPDFSVVAVPGLIGFLHYDVAVRPLAAAAFVSFKVQFRIQP